jgi:hypothetical protein
MTGSNARQEAEMRNTVKTLKTVALALALGASLAVAPPALAGGPHFGFGFGFNPFFDNNRVPYCPELTDYQLRRAVARQGFTNIYLNVRHNHRIEVRATRGEWVYLLRVSTCSGSVLGSQKLRRS